MARHTAKNLLLIRSVSCGTERGAARFLFCVKGLALVVIALFAGVPSGARSFAAGGSTGCSLGKGTKTLCDNYGEDICDKGVYTCAVGSCFVSCTPGDDMDNGGIVNCPHETGQGCTGTILYYPVSNSTGCDTTGCD